MVEKVEKHEFPTYSTNSTYFNISKTEVFRIL